MALHALAPQSTSTGGGTQAQPIASPDCGLYLQDVIALLSDTHGNVRATRNALEILAPHNPRSYLHLGDIGSAEVIREFAGLPVRFLWGNNDREPESILHEAALIGASVHDYLELGTAGRPIFATHGHTSRLQSALRSNSYAAILFGHSHRALNTVNKSTRLVNPGALYRAREYTCALFDPLHLHVTFFQVPKGTPDSRRHNSNISERPAARD